VEITGELVRRLIAGQFPQWGDLPVWPVANSGWDNRTFHLGDTMLVRLPSAPGYVAQVAKEQRFLPLLAPRLPLPIPLPLAEGAPGAGYPWPWSVYRWLPGEIAANGGIADLPQFAEDLAHFLRALQAIDAGDGPPAGEHSSYRGGPLATYDAETRAALANLRGTIDTGAAGALWEEALAAAFRGPPVWVHGDVAPGNLLVRNGRLAAVIDFGCCAVGDPACDLVPAWTFLDAQSRTVFRRALGVDDGMWARGRGWALWKALILRAGAASNAVESAGAQRTLDALVGEAR
jgi:aminoglycoside phosphotransferase (APT) family kinase protein